MGGLNETVMEAEPLLSLPMGPVRTLGDNRVGWIPNCEDAAPPRCAPMCKPTCCAFCAFCAFRYFDSARASGGVCSACYAFCACYLVSACCARCARSTRFQNLTCNTVGHKSAPPVRNVQVVDKGIWANAHTLQTLDTRTAAHTAQPWSPSLASEPYYVGELARERQYGMRIWQRRGEWLSTSEKHSAAGSLQGSVTGAKP